MGHRFTRIHTENHKLAIASSAVSLVLCALFWNVTLIVGPVVAVGIIVMVGFVRWRGDYSPGLGIPLANALGIEGGALIFQPKTLKGIKARAEAASRQ